MLNSLYLRNFQAYKKAKINFSKGVNIIVGKSDAGKSSIIRAIRLIFQNKPRGESYRRHDTKKTEVQLEIDNSTIGRIRSNKNTFTINETELKAMGSDVPDEVSSVLNVGEENIQSQHEMYFLLDKPAGQVAKSLNSVSDLSVMDSAMQKVKSDLRIANKNLEMIDNEIESTKNNIEDLFWIEDAKSSFDLLSEIENTKEELYKKRNNINSIVKDYSKINIEADNLLLKESEIELYNLASLAERSNDLDDRMIALRKLVKRLSELTTGLDEYKDIDTKEIASIELFINDSIDLHNKIKLLSIVIEKASKTQNSLEETKVELNEAEKELNAIEDCPYCGGKI